ncbi:MAG: thioredoxin reductase [Gammaproteobacteria bacterium]|nr:thioredoxin reductase [Gammaproteobacteria bacterium]
MSVKKHCGAVTYSILTGAVTNMSKIDPRDERMFPKLTAAELDRLMRFGQLQHYDKNQPLFVTGEIAPGMFVIKAGRVKVTRRDPIGHLAPIVEEGPGDFVAEVGQLSGRPALVDVHALEELQVLLIPTENLRTAMIAEPELGDRIMRALMLRRVALIETGTGGPVLIGPENASDVVRLQGFLSRNAYPHQVLDPATDPDAADLVEKYSPSSQDLPLAVCPQGTILKNPSEVELARVLGMVRIDDKDRTYDVAIVGAGPAGLATAVYAASEGLSVVVLDARAFGGQAGASARIENYLGFPTGISGQALTGRAYVQAQKFGAEMVIPAEVSRLECGQNPRTLEHGSGARTKAAAVVIASGARYRRLDVPHLREFEGHGVWYWASPIEARLCRREEVALVGAGNSAGQAAMFLRDYVAKIWLLVRGPSLAESMSQYLIDRIEAAPNIDVLTDTEIVALSGSPQGQLQRIRWRHRSSGQETEKPLHHLFLFIGADPATQWLQGCMSLDLKGFVLTGAGVSARGARSSNSAGQAPSLQSSVPGVFAIGDVRSGSVKRVGAAIGEGAAVVAQLHTYLAATKMAAPAKEAAVAR